MSKTETGITVVGDGPVLETREIAKPAAQPAAIEAIIAKAVELGRTGAELKELLDVFERLKAQQSEQQFNRAFAEFQAECPAIPRSREANIASRGGAPFSYRYASLEEIDEVVIPILAKHGLSRSFGDAVIDTGFLTITCRLAHVGGHSRQSEFKLPIQTAAGMSEQQKYGSACTYAKRQAFCNVAGLKTCDLDDDGAGQSNEPISVAQLDEIETLVVKAKADRLRFLAWLQIEAMDELPASRFEEAKAQLLRKMQSHDNR